MSIDPTPPRRVSRRRFLRKAAGVVVGASAATVGYTWRIEPHWVEVVRRPMAVANLPAAWVGRTIVQVSDLHVGPVVDPAFMAAALGRVSKLAADLVVVTGDFMTTAGTEQVPAALAMMTHLAPGRLGTVAILGNHDYGWNCDCPAAADAVCDGLRSAGVTVLRNAVADVGGLQFAGVDDLWGPYFDPAATLARLDPGRASIALCHNPDGVDDPAWAGYRGWILAGHTHGGQCKPPFLPPPLLPVRNRRYVAGAYDVGPGRTLYVNRGLGYLHRVRFNARPEVTVFTLERAAAPA